MRFSATRRFIVLASMSTVFAGCETLQPQFSTAFTETEYKSTEIQASVALPLDLPIANSALSDADDAEKLLRPTNRELLDAPVAPTKTASSEALLPKVIKTDRPLQCVPFARAESGIDIRGNASRWWHMAAGRFVRTKRPEEGSVFVMKGYRSNQRGHVAVVKRVVDARTIVVDHANWGNDGRIHLHAPIRDVSANNDWSKVQVWYTPGNQWGQRVYPGTGFILPSLEMAAAGGAPVGGTN